MSQSTSTSFTCSFRLPLYVTTSPNLDISKNCATGVAYVPNPLFHPDGPTDPRTVRGTKLIVVSAGALGTPGILERSGIGGNEVLEGVGVKQRVDLPGVGENYQGAPSDICW